MIFQARSGREVSTMRDGNLARQSAFATVSQAQENPVTEGPESTLVIPTPDERDGIGPLVNIGRSVS
jgi:hypothetical protein